MESLNTALNIVLYCIYAVTAFFLLLKTAKNKVLSGRQYWSLIGLFVSWVLFGTIFIFGYLVLYFSPEEQPNVGRLVFRPFTGIKDVSAVFFALLFQEVVSKAIHYKRKFEAEKEKSERWHAVATQMSLALKQERQIHAIEE